MRTRGDGSFRLRLTSASQDASRRAPAQPLV